MGTSYSKMGVMAGAAFAIAGVAAVKFAADSVQAAVESEQAVAQLAIAVGGATQAYQDQATALQTLTGYQDEAIMGAQGILTRFDLTEQQINDLMPLVLDYATVTGQDVPSAATALGKALLGNTRALKAIGIEYVATGDRGKDYESLVTALTGSSIAGAASADTFTTAQRKLAAQFDEMKESIGRSLLPMLKAAMQALVDLLPVVQAMVPWIVKLGVAMIALKVIGIIAPMITQATVALGLYATSGALAANVTMGLMAGLSSLLALLGPIAVGIGAVYLAWKIFTGADPTFVPAMSAALVDMTKNTNELTHALEALGADSGGVSKWLRGLEDAARKVGRSLDVATQKARNFANMSDKEFKDFRSGAISSIEDVTSSLSGFSRKWELTASDALKAMRQMALKSKEMARAYKELDRTAMPEKFRAWLTTQGPDEVHAFVGMSKTQQDKFVANWRETNRNTVTAISSLPKKLQEQGTISGQAFEQGMVNGMKSYLTRVAGAARAVAQAAVDAANAALGISSPSTVGREIGYRFVEGVATGILAGGPLTEHALEEDIARWTKAAEKALSKAQDALARVLSKADSLKSTIQGGFASFLDITGALSQQIPDLLNPGQFITAAPSAQSITAFFTQQLADAQRFADILKALQTQGISPELLSQIAQAGPAAIPFAQQLLQMGPEAIASISQTYGAIGEIANQTATGLSEKFFGSKIDELRDEIRGLRQDVRNLGQVGKGNAPPPNDRQMADQIQSLLLQKGRRDGSLQFK